MKTVIKFLLGVTVFWSSAISAEHLDYSKTLGHEAGFYIAEAQSCIDLKKKWFTFWDEASQSQLTGPQKMVKIHVELQNRVLAYFEKTLPGDANKATRCNILNNMRRSAKNSSAATINSDELLFIQNMQSIVCKKMGIDLHDNNKGPWGSPKEENKGKSLFYDLIHQRREMCTMALKR